AGVEVDEFASRIEEEKRKKNHECSPPSHFRCNKLHFSVFARRCKSVKGKVMTVIAAACNCVVEGIFSGLVDVLHAGVSGMSVKLKTLLDNYLKGHWDKEEEEVEAETSALEANLERLQRDMFVSASAAATNTSEPHLTKVLHEVRAAAQRMISICDSVLLLLSVVYPSDFPPQTLPTPRS
ncbi:unnamed protein product, partial [Taenia asiatica]|uniref:Rx_N domain-containing protein n=1 Tax=Taenia asiatica TaxID=60517 RepID=A0A0R3WGQ0_TAEAS